MSDRWRRQRPRGLPGIAMVWLALMVAAVGLEARSEPVAVGQPAPFFELESVGGDRLSLQSLQGRQPLVLIFFRGTW